MKRISLPAAIVLIAASVTTCAVNPAPTPSVDVLFSPKGGCTDRIVAEIGEARSKLRVQVYSFTSALIAKSALDAKRLVLDCEVILDQSQRTEKSSELDFSHN